MKRPQIREAVLCLLVIMASVLLLPAPVSAQQPRFQVLGDTAGAPRGCGTAAVAGFGNWFSAFSAVDSAGLARTMDLRRMAWVFSTGKFTPTDTFVDIHTFPLLLAYARARARHRERLTLEAVHFHGWRGGALNALVYFRRSADDLGGGHSLVAEPVPLQRG